MTPPKRPPRPLIVDADKGFVVVPGPGDRVELPPAVLARIQEVLRRRDR